MLGTAYLTGAGDVGDEQVRVQQAVGSLGEGQLVHQHLHRLQMTPAGIGDVVVGC